MSKNYWKGDDIMASGGGYSKSYSSSHKSTSRGYVSESEKIREKLKSGEYKVKSERYYYGIGVFNDTDYIFDERGQIVRDSIGTAINPHDSRYKDSWER